MSSFAHLRHGPGMQFAPHLPSTVVLVVLATKCVSALSLSRIPCFFFLFQQGSSYQSPQSYMTFLLGSLIKQLRKPAYTKALNLVNYKPPSTFATAENYRWIRKVGGGLFSWRHHFPPSILDAPRRWHADEMNIHEFAEGLYVSQWFPPVSSGYANCILTSPYGRHSPN